MFGLYQKYYGSDPMELSWDRFIAMYGAINEVERTLRGKTEIEIALEQREDELEEEKLEDLREKGIDTNNPFVEL